MEYAFRSHKDPEFGWLALVQQLIARLSRVKPDRARWVSFR